MMTSLGRIRINGRIVFLEIHRTEQPTLIWWLVGVAALGVLWVVL
jgi:hypothetical protein